MDISHRVQPEAALRGCYSWSALEDEEEDHFRVQNTHNRLVEKARSVADFFRCRLFFLVVMICVFHVLGAMLFFVAENGEQCRAMDENHRQTERRREEMLQRMARLQLPEDRPSNVVDDHWLNRTMDAFQWYDNQLIGDHTVCNDFENSLLLVLTSMTTTG
ncbi:unnamed protein product [Soboliphyme baturini]|uniref:Ion_trans domain-containing protein n=1 Tax=Soboliphyme baturini TaxID=241478 RepID=A0A183J0S5_9BILA|nr:unnamed protein product [Soboliphyme baturini]